MIKARNCTDTVNIRTATVVVAALTTGSDIADIPFFKLPVDAVITKVGIIPTGAYTGHADGSVWLVEVGSTAIATATYTVAAAPPEAGVYASLGAITNADQSEDSVLSYSVTNGAGAASPACVLQVEYTVKD